MKVHHLNCGTMRPIATPGGLVCHVLLLETDDGLVLVDSGLGLRCVRDPARRFGPSRFVSRPALDPAEAAVTQVRRLGFDPTEVRDIVLTHCDVDHTGGIADFPWARVHLTAAEAESVTRPATFLERNRYLGSHRDHGPDLVAHEPAGGDPWRGFAAAKELTDIAPGIVLIDMAGHTLGHAAVAIDAGDRWILHVGDAFYQRGQIDGTGVASRTMTTMERLTAADHRKVEANHARLAELWSAAEPDLLLINSHDPTLFEHAAARA